MVENRLFRKLKYIILFIPIFTFGYFSDSPYYAIVSEYGAMSSGSADAFSTTSISNYIVDNNPALLPFGNRLSMNYNKYDYDLLNSIKHSYEYFSFYLKKEKLGIGISLLNYGASTTHNYNMETSQFTLAFGYKVTDNSSFGLNIKYLNGKFKDMYQSDLSNNFCFGLGYFTCGHFKKLTYKKSTILKNNRNLDLFRKLNKQNTNIEGVCLGISLRNLGPDVNYQNGSTRNHDPLPQRFNLGIAYTPIISDLVIVKFGYELERDLVSFYPDRDLDSDGKVGGWNKNGNALPGGKYNKNGKKEASHFDSWYKSIFTSWANDWFLLKDSSLDGIGNDDEDGDNNDGSLKKELNTSLNHFGIDICLGGIAGLKYGRIIGEAGTNKVEAMGFYLGPDFLRYHFSKYYRFGESWLPHTLKLHTLELSYSINFERFLKSI